MDIVEITEWASPEVKTITITQGVGETSYQVQVKEFVPQDGDSLERKWKSGGVQKSHRCAPYAIANMKDAALILKRFVDENIAITISDAVDRNDKLLRPAYDIALNLAQHSQVSPCRT